MRSPCYQALPSALKTGYKAFGTERTQLVRDEQLPLHGIPALVAQVAAVPRAELLLP